MVTTLDSAPEAPGRERARAPLNPKVDVSLSKKKSVISADFLSACCTCLLRQGMYEDFKVIQNSIKATKTNSLQLMRTQLHIN